MSLVPYFRDESVTIYNADARDVLPSLGRFDLLLTDPPYGIGINKSPRLSVSRGFGADNWDEAPPSVELLNQAIALAETQILWGGNYFSLPPTRCFLIWDKANDGRDFADCEFAWTNIDAVARIFRMRPMNMDGGKVHPTQKPESLFHWCVQQAGKVSSILDPFAGSGTTGRVAKDIGATAVLIEREERYCEVAASRLAQQVLSFSHD